MASLIAETQHLFEQATWHVPQGTSIRGQTVSLLVYPCPLPEQDLFDVPITVQPHRGGTQALEGLTLVLQSAAEPGITRYGCLNRRGQVLFRDLTAGTYRTQVVLLPQPIAQQWLESFAQRVSATITSLLAPLPRQDVMMVPSGSDRERRWEHIYQSAGGSLIATLWEQEHGELELDFETRDRTWDGTIVGFVWTAMFAETAQPVANFLLAPLAWSDVFEACIAQVNLGPVPREFELQLPLRSWSPEALTDDMADLIRASVAGAVRTHTRRAWERLLEPSSSLSPALRLVLEETLRT